MESNKMKPIDFLRRTNHLMERIPIKYRIGDWHPFAHLFIFIFIGYLLLTYPIAVENRSYTIYTNDYYTQIFRVIVSLYMLITTLLTLYLVGPLPLASYTITSWNLVSFRILFAWLAGLGLDKLAPIADILRFPALVGASITVIVWWLAIYPTIYILIGGRQNELKAFQSFNRSIPLLNFHLLVLPLVGYEFLLSSHPLEFFDLWAGMAVALLYILFYLNVLDKNGYHFYIVFTPRTPLCILSYGIILSSYIGIYYLWNSIFKHINFH